MRKLLLRSTLAVMLFAFALPLVSPGTNAMGPLAAESLPGLRHVPLPGIAQLVPARCDNYGRWVLPNLRWEMRVADWMAEKIFGECDDHRRERTGKAGDLN